MIIGVPKEVKNNENRIGLTPQSVEQLSKSGHEILVQKDAGKNIGYFDDQYLNAGAKIINTAEDLYKSSEMVVKVKEPIPCLLYTSPSPRDAIPSRMPSSA